MKYFAYGSNMLSQRIGAKTRCESAVPIAMAHVTGYIVRFIKAGMDKSGKATLVQTNNHSDIVYGVLFEIDDTDKELNSLDRAEGVNNGGYQVRTDFTVIFEGEQINNIRTYIAPDSSCQEGLPVFDWYLEHLPWLELDSMD